MFYVIYSKDWNILLNSDSFFFKAKFITGYYWIGNIEKKALFSFFCMVGNNPSDSDSSGIPIFWVILVAKQKFNLQGKKITENKLKSSDYKFNILSPINLRTNLAFAIHKSKTFVMILAKKFDLSGLMLVKKQWYWAYYLCAAYF